MTAGKYFVAIFAVIAEAIGMYSLWVFLYYVFKDHNNPGREAGIGSAMALIYAIPFLAIAAIFFWKIWPYLEAGKILGRRLPLIIALSVFVGMCAWWGLALLQRT
jgi:hypothetical protein